MTGVHFETIRVGIGGAVNVFAASRGGCVSESQLGHKLGNQLVSVSVTFAALM